MQHQAIGDFPLWGDFRITGMIICSLICPDFGCQIFPDSNNFPERRSLCLPLFGGLSDSKYRDSSDSDRNASDSSGTLVFQAGTAENVSLS